MFTRPRETRMSRPVTGPTTGPERRQGRTGRRRLAIGGESGSVVVELALILPVFFLIVFGMLEISRVVYTNHTLAHAAREGARFAMVRGSRSASPASTQDIDAAVRSQAVTLDLNDLGVAVSYNPNNNPGSVVTVQVSYAYQFILPALSPGPLQLTRSSRMLVSR